jgi:hypothetical protein
VKPNVAGADLALSAAGCCLTLKRCPPGVAAGAPAWIGGEGVGLGEDLPPSLVSAAGWLEVPTVSPLVRGCHMTAAQSRC